MLELSPNDNKKKGEVYKQQMEVKLREQMKELESLQSSKVDQKHSALFTEMAGLQSEINQEKAKVEKSEGTGGVGSNIFGEELRTIVRFN